MEIFEEEKIEEERNLEHLIVHNPQYVEKGLTILKHQIPIAGGRRLDILAVDSAGVLVVMELKITEDDRMLPQGIEYVDWINENIDRVAEMYSKPDFKIDRTMPPRLILVAPNFSQTLQKSAKYVARDLCSLSLMEYIYMKIGEKKGLFLREIPISAVQRPSEKWVFKDYEDYIMVPEVKKLFLDIIGQIESIGPEIERNPTQSWYVALQYKGRNLAWLSPRRSYFYLGVRGGDSDIRVEKPGDFTQETYQKIVAAYKEQGGKLQKSLPKA